MIVFTNMDQIYFSLDDSSMLETANLCLLTLLF